MVPKNVSTPLYRTSAFSSEQVLAELSQSLVWRSFQGWRRSRKIRRAARIGEGRRKAQALLKRLDAEQGK